jgi:hypothetical protein
MNLLQREFQDIRARRVAARRAIEKSGVLFSDSIDRAKYVELQRQVLNSTQPRWEEVHALLHKRLPGKPVKLLKSR